MAGALDRRGSAYRRFDPRDFPTSAEVTIEHSRKGARCRRLDYRGESLDLDAVRAVWHRPHARPAPDPEVKGDQIWWTAESSARFLSQLYASLDCLWIPERPVSPREPFRQDDSAPPAHPLWYLTPGRLPAPSPDNKLLQLSVASHAGFTVPRTLFTNSPERFLEFYEACDGAVISKRASDLFPMIGGRVVRSFTTAVRRRDAANCEAVRYAPVAFQENIAKRVELRVTVVGNQVFPAEIRSQESQRQSTDWRHIPSHAQSRFYAEHLLTVDVERRCAEVVRALGLSAGSIDLILTPDGDYVFLEVNPSGQWAYIETMLGLPIGEAIAELLINGQA